MRTAVHAKSAHRGRGRPGITEIHAGPPRATPAGVDPAPNQDAASDRFVDRCLGEVCDVMGIPDEGSGARLFVGDIDVDWEEAPAPRTVRLAPVPTPPPFVPVSPFVHVLPWHAPPVPAPPPTVRTRPAKGVHPAVLACAAVSLFALAASLVVSPAGAENAVKPARALAARLALR